MRLVVKFKIICMGSLFCKVNSSKCSNPQTPISGELENVRDETTACKQRSLPAVNLVVMLALERLLIFHVLLVDLE